MFGKQIFNNFIELLLPWVSLITIATFKKNRQYWSNQSGPVVIIVFAHVVRPSVLTFQNLEKQSKFQVKTIFTTGETVNLVEWIIDDTFLVVYFLQKNKDYVEEICLSIPSSGQQRKWKWNQHVHPMGNGLFLDWSWKTRLVRRISWNG